MNKTKIIFISNLVAALAFYLICGAFSYQDVFSLLPIVLVIFNILTGIIIFLVEDEELGKAFFLVGLIGLLIGVSFCGLLVITR
jgi:hypothetical protein